MQKQRMKNMKGGMMMSAEAMKEMMNQHKSDMAKMKKQKMGGGM